MQSSDALSRRAPRIVRSAAPVREQAVSALRFAVTSGIFQPGERLLENRLCDYLDVSRTVVREALRQLEAEQLVSIVPNVGPIVRELSVDESLQLYDVRSALESLAASLAAERTTPESVARLRLLLDRLRDADGDVEEVIDLKTEFYDAITEMSGNDVVRSMLSNIHARNSQLRRYTLSRPGRHELMLKEVGDIVDAIEAGDAGRAEKLSRLHVQRAKEVAMEALSTQV